MSTKATVVEGTTTTVRQAGWTGKLLITNKLAGCNNCFGGHFGVHTYAVECTKSGEVLSMRDLVSDEEEFDKILSNIVDDVPLDDPARLDQCSWASHN